MSLNSVPQQNNKSNNTSPDYAELVRFLVQPFLENPDVLSVDCETSLNQQKVWIRLAFEGEDKGKVYGRGGRNIQAIRTVISAASALAGQSVYIDIYGNAAHEREMSKSSAEQSQSEASTSANEPRRTNSKPNLRPRSPSSVNEVKS